MLAGIPGHTKMGVMIVLPKIKNCRKCGAFGILDEGISFDTKMRAKRFYYVYCVGCGLKTHGCRTRTDAVITWNEKQDGKQNENN